MSFLDLFKNFNGGQKGFIVNIVLDPIRLGMVDHKNIIYWIRQDLERRKKYRPLSNHLQIFENNLEHPDIGKFLDYYIWYNKIPTEDLPKQKKHKQAVNARKRKLKECINKHRPLSWSAISSFEYSKDDFYSKYVLGEKTDPNSKMLFGNEIGERLSSDPEFFKEEIPRYQIYEKKLIGKIDDIHLVGYLDNFCPDTKNFYEFKTSSSKTRWTQEKAQEHGQIMFYKFLIYQNYGIDPSTINCKLFYIPVEETGDFSMKLSNEPVQCFEVIHTIQEIIEFGNYVKKIWQKMQDFAEKKELAL